MKRLIPVALGLILLWAAGLTICTMSSQAYRIDEAVQVGLSQLPLEVLLPELPRNDPHPPGFHLILKVWMGLFGDSVAATRMLSLIFGLMAILAVYSLGKRLDGEMVGLCAAALMAGSVFFLHYAQTARMYTLFLALTTFSLSSLLAYMEERKPRDLWLYFLNAAVLVWVHYLGLMELVVELFLFFIVAMRTQEHPVRRAWLGILGAVTGPIALVVIFWHKAMILAPERRFPFLVPGTDLQDRLSSIWQTLLMLHTGPLRKGYDPFWFKAYTVICLVLVITGVAAMFFWRKERKSQASLLVGYQLLMWWSILGMLIRVNSFYQVRYFLSTLSVHLVLAAFGLAAIARWLGGKEKQRSMVVYGVVGGVTLLMAASPALFNAVSLWRRTEEIPYREAAKLMKEAGVKKVIYTGLERIPMGFVYPKPMTFWANSQNEISLALQGSGNRAVVVYVATADKFTPWMRPWLKLMADSHTILKGSEDDLALYFFEEQSAFHGVRVKPGKLLLPVPGSYECLGEETPFEIETDQAARVRIEDPCLMGQKLRPDLLHPPTDPTENNKFYNYYLHWAGMPLGPALKAQRSKDVRFWPVDRIVEPEQGTGTVSVIHVLAPNNEKEWSAVTMGQNTKAVWWFWADKAGDLDTYWKLNYPTGALFAAKLNGRPFMIRLSGEKRNEVLKIRRPGPQALELENQSGTKIEIQGFRMIDRR